MGDGAVVALEVVLDADLPVRVVLALRPLVEDERVDVDPAFGHEPRQVAQVLLRAGPHAWSGLTKTNGPQVSTSDGDEAEAFPVEAGLAVRPRRTSQRAVEVVRPRVVRALQRLALARAVAEEGAAMPADVDERAQLTVTVADEDDGHIAGAARDERARLAQLAGVAGVLPGLPEDPLLLEAGYRRIDVPVPGDRLVAGHRRHGSDASDRLRLAPAACRLKPRRWYLACRAPMTSLGAARPPTASMNASTCPP